MDLTSGTLLGGRVIYRQPRVGYRTGIEPVLLAASIPARPGERMLEAGTGAGAALLCLLARVPGTTGVGVERDGGLAALAEANLGANGPAAATVLHADLLAVPATACERFDHAMANPPWHDAQGTASPNGMRDAAKRAGATLLGEWAAAMARLVRPGGQHHADRPGSVCRGRAGMRQRRQDAVTWRCCRFGRVPGRKHGCSCCRGSRQAGGRAASCLGLALHDASGYADMARRILWDGAALPWA